MGDNGPLEDPIAEAERIASAASAARVHVKLMGGAGIHLHRADAAYTDRDRYAEKYCRDALRLMGDDAQIPQSEAFQRQLLGPV